MTIQLSRPKEQESIVLDCLDTSKICMPVFWQATETQVEADEEIKLNSTVKLVDHSAGVNVECFEIIAREGGYFHA